MIAGNRARGLSMTDESSPAAAGAPTWASYLAHGAVRHDLFGLPVATTSAACAAEVAAFQHNVLAYGSDWASGSRAADADPGCALAQLMAADGAVAEEDMAAATAALAEAERLVGAAGAGVPSRERRYADAYSAWLGGDAAAAGELFELLARDYPRDLFALKRAQLCYFILGKADRVSARTRRRPKRCRGSCDRVLTRVKSRCCRCWHVRSVPSCSATTPGASTSTAC